MLIVPFPFHGINVSDAIFTDILDKPIRKWTIHHGIEIFGKSAWYSSSTFSPES